MREFLFFIASLAGAVTLTALAVLLRPESLLWKFLLWGGIGIFIACAFILVFDYYRPGSPKTLLGLMRIGIALAVGCAIALIVGAAPETSQSSAPNHNAFAILTGTGPDYDTRSPSDTGIVHFINVWLNNGTSRLLTGGTLLVSNLFAS